MFVRVNRCGVRDELVAGVGRRENVRIALEALEHRKFGAFSQLNVERVDELNVCLLARVVAAAKHREADEFVGFDAKPRDDGGGQRRFDMIERELEFVDAQHACPRSMGGELVRKDVMLLRALTLRLQFFRYSFSAETTNLRSFPGDFIT